MLFFKQNRFFIRISSIRGPILDDHGENEVPSDTRVYLVLFGFEKNLIALYKFFLLCF